MELIGYVFDGKQMLQNPMRVIVDELTNTITSLEPLDHLDKEIQLFLMPGMIDAHVHFQGSKDFDVREFSEARLLRAGLRSVNDLLNLVNAGFLAVRDLGSKCGIELSRAISEGYLNGPDIIPCYHSLSATGGDDDQKDFPLELIKSFSDNAFCDGPWECRKAVREQIREGAKVIKVYARDYGSLGTGPSKKPFLTEEEIEAVVKEAHGLGIKVAAHAYGSEGIMSALNAGIDSIEHGFGLTEEICEIMSKKGTYYVPTITVHMMFEKYKTGKWKEILDNHLYKDIPMAQSYGLNVVSGTDIFGGDICPHGQNYKELVYMHKYGLDKERTLVSTTSLGAQCLGLEKAGKIAAGFKANIIGFRKTPDDELSSLSPENICFIMKNGKVLKNI